MNYRTWLTEIAEIYEAANEPLQVVQDQRIIDHAEVLDGVFRTTYESGYSTIVNYREDAVSIDGTVVDGRSFRVIREVARGEN